MRDKWEAKAIELGYKNKTEMFYDLYTVKKQKPSKICLLIGVGKDATLNQIRLCGITPNKRGGANNVGQNKDKSEVVKKCIFPGCERMRRDNNKFTRYCSKCFSKIQTGRYNERVEDASSVGGLMT